ncbi:MAG TPA: cytochrome c peroxidase [Xanthobacteraceae bacterium]
MALAVVVPGLPAQRGHAAAIVGETHYAQPTTQPPRTPEALKEDYRRPSTIPFPKENPYTPAKAALGKRLYFDTRLSGGNVLSCGTCHSPAFGWGDGLPKGIGHGMRQLDRRSPTIINAAWGQIFMWDGRAATLEEQALGPIQAAAEMNLPLDVLMDRLAHIKEYQPLFAAAFPNEGIVPASVAKAIATYERSVVSNPAPFDAWLEGQSAALSESARRGFALFNAKAGCASCHAGWNFTDESFADIGLPGDDVGRGKLATGVVKMQHAFKTPGLREISHRGPYMHDGSIPTLEAVVEHYDRGGIDRPSRSDLIKPLGLTAQEKADLVSFLNALTSRIDPTIVPILPR